MRTLGRPSASTVASAMALGSLGSDCLGLLQPFAEQGEGVVAFGEAAEAVSFDKSLKLMIGLPWGDPAPALSIFPSRLAPPRRLSQAMAYAALHMIANAAGIDMKIRAITLVTLARADARRLQCR